MVRFCFSIIISLFLFLSNAISQTDTLLMKRNKLIKIIQNPLKVEFPSMQLEDWGFEEIVSNSSNATKVKHSFFEIVGKTESGKRIYITYNKKGIELFRVLEYKNKKQAPALLQQIIDQIENPIKGAKGKIVEIYEIIGVKYASEKGYQLSVEYNYIMGKNMEYIYYDGEGKQYKTDLKKSLLEKAFADLGNF